MIYNSEKEFLENYDDSQFEKLSVTVDPVIFTLFHKESGNYRKLSEKELRLLLVKRNDFPCKGMWSLPGGFVTPDKNLEDSLRTKVASKTGISDVYFEQLYTWGDIGRDPRCRIISVSYMTLINSDKITLREGAGVEEAKWFTIKHDGRGIVLTDGENSFTAMNHLAFDHMKIISYAFERLRNKIEYTDIVFNIMPTQFTLTELQQVYEIVLGEKLLTANFRRKISPLLEECGETTGNLGHRPAQLFRKKVDKNEESDIL